MTDHLLREVVEGGGKLTPWDLHKVDGVQQVGCWQARLVVLVEAVQECICHAMEERGFQTSMLPLLNPGLRMVNELDPDRQHLGQHGQVSFQLEEGIGHRVHQLRGETSCPLCLCVMDNACGVPPALSPGGTLILDSEMERKLALSFESL